MNSKKLNNTIVLGQNKYIIANAYSKTIENHLQLPLLATFKFGRTLKFFTSVGVAPYLSLSNRVKPVDNKYEIAVDFNYQEPDGPSGTLIYLQEKGTGGAKSADISRLTHKTGYDVLFSIGFERKINQLVPFIETRLLVRPVYNLYDSNASIAICGGVKF